MNHSKARQRKSDGRWDYTRSDRYSTSALGYCAGYSPWTPEMVERVFGLMDGDGQARQLAQLNEPIERTRDRYHTDGHATEEEACACYASFLLDHELHLDGSIGHNQQLRCAVCDEWTQGEARIGSRSWVLCDAHRTREVVAERLTVGESWSS